MVAWIGRKLKLSLVSRNPGRAGLGCGGLDGRHRGTAVSWYDNVFELIDLRSFSNLWYWIALAVTWSTASHWVLGVPFDLVTRARRGNEAVQRDLEALVRINVNRLLYIGDVAGVVALSFAFAFLSALAVLGFWYGVEFAQAVFLLGFPIAIVRMLGLRVAHRIHDRALGGVALRMCLSRHRMVTQVIGLFAIFVTAMWGMWQNMHIGVLGG